MLAYFQVLVMKPLLVELGYQDVVNN